MASDTAIELWRSFADFLTVELEFGDPPNVAAVVSNTAPEDSTGPVIIFEDVRLTVTGGTAQQSSNIPTLQPGVVHRVEITTRDTAGVFVEIHGRVSHRQFFSVRSQADPPVELTSPVVQEFLERIEDLAILDTCEDARHALADVGDQSTLGELERLSSMLEDTEERIRVYGKATRCSVLPAQAAIADTLRGYLGPLTSAIRRAKASCDKGDLATLLQCCDQVVELEPPFEAYSRAISTLESRYVIGQ
ncbi:MAG: hypothetical protein IIB26_04410 [Chloroflexi bacterium]|nr:hypothetical protein [Chloroflexota bacterium]